MSGFSLEELKARRLVFERGPNPGHPFRAVVDGREVLIRLGDFPAEAMYTLVVDGQDGDEFEDWPAQWQRPSKSNFMGWLRRRW